jgi:hypothetical protein
MAENKTELYMVTCLHPIDLDDGRSVGPGDWVEIAETDGTLFRHNFEQGWLTKSSDQPAKKGSR